MLTRFTGIMSGLQTHVPDSVKEEWGKNPAIGNYMKSPAQGAATTVWAAVGKEWSGKGGNYLEDCGEAGPCEDVSNILALGYAPHAYNEEGEKRLWKDSLQMVGLKDDE